MSRRGQKPLRWSEMTPPERVFPPRERRIGRVRFVHTSAISDDEARAWARAIMEKVRRPAPVALAHVPTTAEEWRMAHLHPDGCGCARCVAKRACAPVADERAETDECPDGCAETDERTDEWERARWRGATYRPAAKRTPAQLRIVERLRLDAEEWDKRMMGKARW